MKDVSVSRAWLESLAELSEKADCDLFLRGNKDSSVPISTIKLIGFASSAKTILNLSLKDE